MVVGLSLLVVSASSISSIMLLFRISVVTCACISAEIFWELGMGNYFFGGLNSLSG